MMWKRGVLNKTFLELFLDNFPTFLALETVHLRTNKLFKGVLEEVSDAFESTDILNFR